MPPVSVEILQSMKLARQYFCEENKMGSAYEHSLSAVPSVAVRDTHPSFETTPVRVKVKRTRLSPTGQAVIASSLKQKLVAVIKMI